MNFHKIIKVAASVAVAAVFCMPSGAGANLTARANHDHITIDMFYHGSEVSVRGVADPDVELVVKLESPETHLAMKKKDKVGGLLWMNVGNEDFGKVPDLYFVQSTRPLDEIVSPEEQDKHLLGFKALERHAIVRPANGPEEKAKWFSEFLRFKESSKLYMSKAGGFDINNQGPVKAYYMKFDWPYQAKPGYYVATVYALKDGKVIETATSSVNVEQVGTVKTLSRMAKDRGAVYGGLSVIIALAAGFGVGIVFKKGGGAH